ncbi:MAG: trypsin-like peptidase domain-containing protein [Pseudomonadota bacterium]
MSLRFCLIVALISVVAATTPYAQTKDRLDRRDVLFGYEGVGRLESARGQCTAALIARDVAVTAAHCVLGKGTDFVFRAAYSDGAALATRRVEDIVVAPGYIAARNSSDYRAQTANDVALVRLVSPIHDANTDPYAIARTPRQGAALTLASYGRGRSEALTLERGCVLQTRFRGGVVEIDCDATYGSSGAPVFTQVDGRPQVFAVVTGGLDDPEGRPVTYAVELAQIVPGLLTTLRKNRALAPVNTGARRLSVGDRAAGGGIRFHRPGD